MSDFHRLGLGTYENTDPADCRNAVRAALEAGYRHVDTAQMYDNETYVGGGIADADVERDEVFLATKLDTDNLARDAVHETTAESLEALDTEYVDLLYVHWPIDGYDPAETLPALDTLRTEGAIRNVGLSNFTPDLLEEAIEHLESPVFAHQVEMHPLLQQDGLHERALADDHWLVAYCPVARGQVADVPELVEIAGKHDATPYQVSLAWLLSKENVAAIPKATSEAHIVENYGALDLDLDDGDVARIDGIEREERLVDFPAAPWNE
ncbi:aldo/keto reductase [Halarchaeum nitratireducens]|uniref:Aldehyde oxidoreductase n=1 Tax=Halarchaeum nitratireducens TaxID=489913 RepID=A0A830G9A8_9EURY|nr:MULTISPECIES: aldo/keto reductase [Halarchaeum]MBP2249752.1 diketogulonate reductase-like aldo/keto reductase [Halarchaeum solikamskense]GGN10789.1 aldehyde oxidoreductase [Halarchaeum nitratireducens]